VGTAKKTVPEEIPAWGRRPERFHKKSGTPKSGAPEKF
jgi:hypothetical protein